MSGTASRQHLFEIFGYTTASISNWVWTCKNEKHLVQRSSRHRKAIFNGADLKRFSELLEKSVSLTLAEIKEHFGVQCSLVAIHKTLTKLGFVFKKTLKASEQEHENIARQRKQWCEFQTEVAPCRLIFIDESGVKTNRTRLYGRARKCRRCMIKLQIGDWKLSRFYHQYGLMEKPKVLCLKALWIAKCLKRILRSPWPELARWLPSCYS